MGKEVGGDVEEAAEEAEDLLHTSDQNENSGEIRFSCETCEEEFNSLEELGKHVRSHLVESEPGEPNQCPPCKQNFETVNEFVDHMRVNHDACLRCLKVEDGAKCAWCKRTEHIQAQRNSAQKRQQEQAEAMLTKSAKNLRWSWSVTMCSCRCQTSTVPRSTTPTCLLLLWRRRLKGCTA